MYSARLAKVPGIQVTSLLCPFQWTTIPDFLQILSANETYAPSLYDHVILHAGIVDHSPRPLQQMLAKLYSPEAVTEPAVVHQLLRKRNFSSRKDRKSTRLNSSH